MPYSKDNNGLTPLHHAACRGDMGSVKALLKERGTKVNAVDKRRRSSLHYAALCGQTAVVEALLDAEDIDVNAADKDGWTSLHCAAKEGHRKVVKALLAKGADVNKKDNDGKIPLYYAKGIRVTWLFMTPGEKGIVAGIGTGLIGGTIAIALFVSDVIEVEPLPIFAAAVIVGLAVFAAVYITYIVTKPNTEMKGQNVNQHVPKGEQIEV